MAINFLDTINLNGNQIDNIRIQNVTSDPTTNVTAGDIIFNTSTSTLKYYDGTNPFSASGWISLTANTTGMTSWTVTADNDASVTVGDGQTVDWAGGTGISTAYSTPSGNRTVTITNSKPFDGLTLAATTGSNSSIANSGTITIAAGAGITATNNASGTVTIAATGSGSMSSFDLAGDSGTNQTISDGNTLTVAGGTNITTTAAATDTVTVNLRDTITLAGDLTVNGGDITLGGTGRIQGVDTVTAATDAASKAYVDSTVAGGLNVKGGFNANTGAIVSGGNLTSGGSRVAIAIGDYYIVTVAGNFFGNAATPLTPGDSVLVQTAANAGASVEGDFAVIQSDTDLATLTNVGLGNVNADANGEKKGISVSYSSGTADVGLDITGLSNIALTYAGGDELVVYDTDANENKKVSITNFFNGRARGASAPLNSSLAYVTRTVANSRTTFVIDTSSTSVFGSGTNSDLIKVEVMQASDLSTVYPLVKRTSESPNLTIEFAGNVADSTYQVLLTLVG